MYRLFLTILLCLKVASPAPQAKESDVTYVKIQPVVEETPVAAARHIRESRIEKLPLTIPGNVSQTDSKEPDKNLADLESNRSENKSGLSQNNSDVSENKSASSETKLDLSENLDSSESKQSERLSDPSGTDESNTDTTDDLSEISPTDDLSQSDTENLSDTVPSETRETNQTERRARNFDSVETTDTTEDATEKSEDELIDHTAIEAPRTRAPPKFVPKPPKLSYFQKPRVFQSYSSNQLEHAGKRRFRSRCSCQKIWNCPKLQITVPRCPEEYFLCCF